MPNGLVLRDDSISVLWIIDRVLETGAEMELLDSPATSDNEDETNVCLCKVLERN